MLTPVPTTCLPPHSLDPVPFPASSNKCPHLAQVLANKVRAKVQEARSANRALSAADGFCPSTVRLLNRFLEQGQTQAPAPGAGPSFPPGLKQ